MNTPITHPCIEELRARIQRLEGAAARRRSVLPFGIKAIDRHLLGGGLALGALHEVAGGGNGAINGAAVALFAAGIAARTQGKVLWCIRRPDLFAPVPGVGRARWQLELIRCRAGESADFEVEACWGGRPQMALVCEPGRNRSMEGDSRYAV